MSALLPCVCIRTTCIPSAHRDQKRMELQMVMTYHVSGGKQIQDLCKSNKCLNH